MRLSKKQILSKAAERIQSKKDDYCCVAIRRASKGKMEIGDRLAKEFGIFYDLDTGIESLSFEYRYYKDDDRFKYDESLREARVLALLLFAELCK